jgi:hypothetical protein
MRRCNGWTILNTCNWVWVWWLYMQLWHGNTSSCRFVFQTIGSDWVFYLSNWEEASVLYIYVISFVSHTTISFSVWDGPHLIRISYRYLIPRMRWDCFPDWSVYPWLWLVLCSLVERRPPFSHTCFAFPLRLASYIRRSRRGVSFLVVLTHWWGPWGPCP